MVRQTLLKIVISIAFRTQMPTPPFGFPSIPFRFPRSTVLVSNSQAAGGFKTRVASFFGAVGVAAAATAAAVGRTN